MLSILTVSAQQAAHYYSIDNYSSQEESRNASNWFGKSAHELRLTGSVDANSFETLLHGHTPNQTPLYQRANIKRTAAIDLTFSAPKSISIAALWGGDLNLSTAHNQAVTVALKFIESNSRTSFLNGHRRYFQLTGNLLIAQFAHTISRAQDPQIHTHNVTINTTRTENIWRALDARPLFKRRKLWQAVYHQELALLSRNYGYNLIRSQKHIEIEGYNREQLEYWSKRRRQIIEATGPEASSRQRQVACLRTRPQKPVERSLENLRRQWEEESLQLGQKIIHPQPNIYPQIDPSERLQAARLRLEQISASLGPTDAIDSLAVVEQAFGSEGWGNPQASFGYLDLEEAISQAVEERNLHKKNGLISRSTQIYISNSKTNTDQVSSPYPRIDAIGNFANLNDHHRAALIAPKELRQQTTKAVRLRLWQLNKLSQPQTAIQQTPKGNIEVEIYAGDRLRVPSRTGAVQVLVEPSEKAHTVNLKHRNGRVTEWDLQTPKSFEFDWVQSCNGLPKHQIDFVYAIGSFSDKDLAKLSKKARRKLFIYEPEGKSLSVQNLEKKLTQEPHEQHNTPAADIER